jgi:hypothetical protein
LSSIREQFSQKILFSYVVDSPCFRKRIEHKMLARKHVTEVLVPGLLLIFSTGCGGVSGSGVLTGGTPPPASTHVFLVVEENHSYSQVIGNSSMPYLNSLAAKYGLATHYYADVHPSIGTISC